MTYTVESLVSTGEWEPVPEGEFDREIDAIAGMRELEKILGWRDLRVVDGDGQVVEYGLTGEAGQ